MQHTDLHQNKKAELEFFGKFDHDDGYDRFDEKSYNTLLGLFEHLIRPRPGERLVDLGCGTGAFTARIKKAHSDLQICGIDLTEHCIHRATLLYPNIQFQTGDIEASGLETGTFDIVTLFGVLHHFPNLTMVANEVNRILKPGGRFFAFDPHQQNPFFWLYRSRSSPFYSPNGVTLNERLLNRKELLTVFSQIGFDMDIQALSGLSFCAGRSPASKWLVPTFNVLDKFLSVKPLVNQFGAWLITRGIKRKA